MGVRTPLLEPKKLEPYHITLIFFAEKFEQSMLKFVALQLIWFRTSSKAYALANPIFHIILMGISMTYIYAEYPQGPLTFQPQKLLPSKFVQSWQLGCSRFVPNGSSTPILIQKLQGSKGLGIPPLLYATYHIWPTPSDPPNFWTTAPNPNKFCPNLTLYMVNISAKWHLHTPHGSAYTPDFLFHGKYDPLFGDPPFGHNWGPKWPTPHHNSLKGFQIC
mgnify:CR=1 FL=1